jgi:hypothetical protein
MLRNRATETEFSRKNSVYLRVPRSGILDESGLALYFLHEPIILDRLDTQRRRELNAATLRFINTQGQCRRYGKSVENTAGNGAEYRQ